MAGLKEEQSVTDFSRHQGTCDHRGKINPALHTGKSSVGARVGNKSIKAVGHRLCKGLHNFAVFGGGLAGKGFHGGHQSRDGAAQSSEG